VSEPLPAAVETLGTAVVDCAFRVHKTLGPGLLESVYVTCLAYELSQRGIPVSTQIPVPVVYGELRFETGFRLDLLVGDQVIVEVKSIERDAPIFQAQLMTYLKVTGKRLGFLINFNVPLIKSGIKRVLM
jgi:GxxExxY protein